MNGHFARFGKNTRNSKLRVPVTENDSGTVAELKEFDDLKDIFDRLQGATSRAAADAEK